MQPATGTVNSGSVAASVLHAMERCRNVRHYTGELPDDEVVRGLLDAAVLAPTALDSDPCSFVVIQDRAMLQRCSERAKRGWLATPRSVTDVGGSWRPRLADPAHDIFHGAGTLILICGCGDLPLAEADCWLAAGNLMLAAVAHGLGSCCIDLAIPLFNQTDLKRELWIADDCRVVVPVVVGLPLAASVPVARRSADILRWAV